MPTGICLVKGLSSYGAGHWANVWEEFKLDHMPHVNTAQMIIGHLQPHCPCCCSSFHFLSPMFPLFPALSCSCGPPHQSVAFGCFLPFRVTEWKDNDEIWEVFMTTLKPSDFSYICWGQLDNFSQQSTQGHKGVQTRDWKQIKERREGEKWD